MWCLAGDKQLQWKIFYQQMHLAEQAAWTASEHNLMYIKQRAQNSQATVSGKPLQILDVAWYCWNIIQKGKTKFKTTISLICLLSFPSSRTLMYMWFNHLKRKSHVKGKKATIVQSGNVSGGSHISRSWY